LAVADLQRFSGRVFLRRHPPFVFYGIDFSGKFVAGDGGLYGGWCDIGLGTTVTLLGLRQREHGGWRLIPDV